jgi:hypothetical protein
MADNLNPYPSAQEVLFLTQMKNSGLGSDMPLIYLIFNALSTAINAGSLNTSTTVSVSGKSSQDIQYHMNVLSSLGFQVSMSGTTLTIGWVV